MSVLAQIFVIFGIYLASEGISAVLPFTFPASVLAMLILLALLASGVLKPKQLQQSAGFFLDHMAFFFVPVTVSVLKHADVLLANFWSLILISVLTTPLVFCVTGHVVQLTIRLMNKKEEDSR